jgi:hypothetical protein
VRQQEPTLVETAFVSPGFADLGLVAGVLSSLANRVDAARAKQKTYGDGETG